MTDYQYTPFLVCTAFVASTAYALYLLKKAYKPSKTILLWAIIWLVFQGLLAYFKFYRESFSMPPRILMAVGPPQLLIFYLIFSERGKKWFYQLDLEKLHRIHSIRFPVEVVLWFLFLQSQLPQILTFEGTNYNIIAGLTAPIIASYGVKKGIIDRKRILLWNFIGFFMLLNIVVCVFLSAQTPFQQFAFNEPNKALITFPFIWLPSFILPLVFFTHLVSIRILYKEKNDH